MSLKDKTYYNGIKAQKFIWFFSQNETALVVHYVSVTIHLAAICGVISKITQDMVILTEL